MENEFEMGGIFVKWEIFHSHFIEIFGKMEMEWKPFFSNGGGLVQTYNYSTCAVRSDCQSVAVKVG